LPPELAAGSGLATGAPLDAALDAALAALGHAAAG
jgi:hypothetical protein